MAEAVTLFLAFLTRPFRTLAFILPVVLLSESKQMQVCDDQSGHGLLCQRRFPFIVVLPSCKSAARVRVTGSASG